MKSEIHCNISEFHIVSSSQWPVDPENPVDDLSNKDILDHLLDERNGGDDPTDSSDTDDLSSPDLEVSFSDLITSSPRLVPDSERGTSLPESTLMTSDEIGSFLNDLDDFCSIVPDSCDKIFPGNAVLLHHNSFDDLDNSCSIVPDSCNEILPGNAVSRHRSSFDQAATRTKAIENEEATGMQRLLAAEDALALEISQMLYITSNPDLLESHISPAIHARLFRSSSPILKPLAIPEPRKSPKISVAPTISFPPPKAADDVAPRNLIPFERQRQQRRHEAHGIR